MWSDSESDDDYFGPNRQCEFRYKKPVPELRFRHGWEFWAKKHMALSLGSSGRATGDVHDVDGWSVRAVMRDLSLRDGLGAMEDWREPRVKRFFYDITGFHLGSLDLTGRFRTRYAKLRARWDAYILDFFRLAPFVTMVDVVRQDLAQDHRVVDVTVTIPVVSDAARWLEFRTKWQLSPLQQYEDIAPPTEYALQVVEAHPNPRFQELMLHHLPPEIILRIFTHIASGSSEDCCRFSATSRFFRACGLGFIFSSRTLNLGQAFAWPSHARTTAAERPDPSSVWKMIQLDFDALIDRMDFLAARPDICRELRHLEFKHNWCPVPFPRPNALSFAFIQGYDHVKPALQKLDAILSMASIVSLTMLYWPIDANLLISFARQTRLIEATFEFCILTSMAERLVAAGPVRVLSSSLRYIKFDLTCGELQSTIWGILALCPHLTHLNARAIRPYAGFTLPADNLLLHLSATLRSIERLDLYGLSSSDAPQLASWLQAAASHGGLRVTHLRLLFDRSVPDGHIADLLRALRSGAPPLEVLVLDGPALSGTLPILELIGQLFPALEGLTIMRLAGSRRDDRKSCHWPLPIYEYASQLARFTKLRYLGTNFRHDYHSLWPELGEFFDGMVPDEEIWREREEMERAYGPGSQGRALSYQALARPFAACCPSLELFALHLESDLRCRIERGESGCMRCSAATMTMSEAYCPSRSRTWERPRM